MKHVKRSHRYSTIATEEREKAQIEWYKKLKERKRLSKEIWDLQAVKKKPTLIYLHKPQMYFIKKYMTYKTNLNNNSLY